MYKDHKYVLSWVFAVVFTMQFFGYVLISDGADNAIVWLVGFGYMLTALALMPLAPLLIPVALCAAVGLPFYFIRKLSLTKKEAARWEGDFTEFQELVTAAKTSLQETIAQWEEIASKKGEGTAIAGQVERISEFREQLTGALGDLDGDVTHKRKAEAIVFADTAKEYVASLAPARD